MTLHRYDLNADMRSVLQRLGNKYRTEMTDSADTQPAPAQQEGTHEEESSSQRHVPPVGR